MRKLYIPFIFLVTILAAFFAYGNNMAIKPANWQLIYGTKIPNSTFYVDSNSLGSSTIDEGTFNYGTILIVSDGPAKITVNETTFIARSLAKEVVIDCPTGLVLPITDYYFASAKPARNEKPVKAFEYADRKYDAVVLSKNDPVRLALCPNFI